MDRPTALDLAFLDLETPQAPLHVGWTLRFGGPPPSLAALRRHLDARLHGVPRFRRRLVRPRLPFTAPHWADDPGFDIARHAFAVSIAPPGGAGELRGVVGTLLSEPLPHDRPLWRMYLVDGLAGGGFALVGQAHHALVDGIAAVDVALLLFGAAREGRAGARGWAPERSPTAGEALRATAGVRARAAASTARELAAAAVRPGALHALREAARTVESLARPPVPTHLSHSATSERVVGFGDLPFEAARDAGRRAGATVNDVLLAATTLALRRALRRRGDGCDALRALVPVSVRADDACGELGNRISFLPVELPVGETDPGQVLALVRARTAAAKAGGDAVVLQSLARAADALPGAGRRVLTRTAARAVGFHLVVSNVPGPMVQLALLGRPLLAVHPMVPLLHGHALTIGAVSYAGRLHLGLAADAAVVPDVVEIARDVESGFDALRVAAGAVPELTPWRAQARSRRQRAASR